MKTRQVQEFRDFVFHEHLFSLEVILPGFTEYNTGKTRIYPIAESTRNHFPFA